MSSGKRLIPLISVCLFRLVGARAAVAAADTDHNQLLPINDFHRSAMHLSAHLRTLRSSEDPAVHKQTRTMDLAQYRQNSENFSAHPLFTNLLIRPSGSLGSDLIVYLSISVFFGPVDGALSGAALLQCVGRQQRPLLQCPDSLVDVRDYLLRKYPVTGFLWFLVHKFEFDSI